MINRNKVACMLLAAVMMGSTATAQDTKPNKSNYSHEEIIIRKKGDKAEKTTIVIDGDKVTVNGKPMEDYKGENITVMKMKRPGAVGAARTRAYSMSPDMQEFRALAPAMGGNRALLGVTTEKTEGGVKINSVTNGSGAEKAGLQKGDVITRVGESKIESPADLVEAVRKKKPTDKVEIAYNRNGKNNKTTAVLGENKNQTFSFNSPDVNFNFDLPARPNAPSINGDMFVWNRKPKIGLQIQDLEEGKGVKVNEVDDDSPAAKSGFKEGDVITEINGKEIEGVDELRQEIKDMKEGDSFKINFKRDGKSQAADLKIPKRLKTADL